MTSGVTNIELIYAALREADKHGPNGLSLDALSEATGIKKGSISAIVSKAIAENQAIERVSAGVYRIRISKGHQLIATATERATIPLAPIEDAPVAKNKLNTLVRRMDELSRDLHYFINEYQQLVEKGRRYDKLSMEFKGYSSADPDR